MLMNKDTLIEIGFKQIGTWKLTGDNPQALEYEWLPDEESQNMLDVGNVLYAFTVDKDVKYIGKTTQGVQKRFIGYKKPGNSQATNNKCNQNILNLLQPPNNKAVEIWLYAPTIPLQIAGFNVNVAAGLEDSLIDTFKPAWNGSKKLTVALPDAVNFDTSDFEVENIVEQQVAQLPLEGKPIFTIQLGATYYNQGFINPGVAVDSFLGNHGESLKVMAEVENGKYEIISSKINRTANRILPEPYGTVRVVGNNAEISRWFKRYFQFGDTVTAHVEDRNTIVLHLPKTL